MKIPLLCVLCLFAGLSWAQTQQVAMRDGVRLATDIYGAEPGVRRSALLLRTPYNKGGAKDTAERFARGRLSGLHANDLHRLMHGASRVCGPFPNSPALPHAR